VGGRAAAPKGNGAVLASAVEEVADGSRRLLAQLVTTAPARDREVEAARARARAEKRFGRAA